MYSAKVMDHFANPRNVGEIENADGVGEVGNPKCGDIMKMFLKIDNNVITDVKFKTFGCGAAIATSSIATEMIKGKTIDEALKLALGDENAVEIDRMDMPFPAYQRLFELVMNAVTGQEDEPDKARFQTEKGCREKSCFLSAAFSPL